LTPVALVVLTLAVKFAFLAWCVPRRDERQPRVKGTQLARLVPTGAVLYLFRLKDEGILFYYGGPTRRLAGPECLPGGAPAYCLLLKAEWRRWPPGRPAAVRGRFCDEQGAPLVLVEAREPPGRPP
jgi:hypothetical protein